MDLAQNSNVQDAFVIAVEQQARERLERLSALKRIKPVDIQGLSKQVNINCNPFKKKKLSISVITLVFYYVLCNDFKLQKLQNSVTEITNF